MLLVHSFWSKPMKNQLGTRISNLKFSSWVNKQMFFFTYCMSTLQMQKHKIGKTILVTDTFGKELLINQLELPYDEVIVKLDDLNEYPKEFWALGKIYAYSLIKEPFIHIDYDFLMATDFERDLLEAPLVAYMDENDNSRQGPYKKCVDEYFSNYIIPENIAFYVSNYQYKAFNAGVIGGNNIEIFNELWVTVKTLLEVNRSAIENDIAQKKKSFYMTNVILEQYFFTCLAQRENINITCLHNNENLLPDDGNFWIKDQNLPKYKAKYFPAEHVHMVGHNKGYIDNAIVIENELKKASPYHFNHINNLIKSNWI